MILEPLWTSPWSRDRVCRRRARWTPWTHRSSGTTRRRCSTRRRTMACGTRGHGRLTEDRAVGYWRLAGAIRDVAQLGSALDWGSRGRRFKSCHPDSVFAGQRAVPALTSSGGAALELSACRPRVGRAERDGRPGGKGQPSNVQEPVESLEPSPRHRRPLCFLELRPLRSAPFTAPGGRILGAACGAATPSGLAITGVQLNTLLGAIVVLVGVGAGLTVVARRRLQV